MKSSTLLSLSVTTTTPQEIFVILRRFCFWTKLLIVIALVYRFLDALSSNKRHRFNLAEKKTVQRAACLPTSVHSFSTSPYPPKEWYVTRHIPTFQPLPFPSIENDPSERPPEIWHISTDILHSFNFDAHDRSLSYGSTTLLNKVTIQVSTMKENFVNQIASISVLWHLKGSLYDSFFKSHRLYGWSLQRQTAKLPSFGLPTSGASQPPERGHIFSKTTELFMWVHSMSSKMVKWKNVLGGRFKVTLRRSLYGFNWHCYCSLCCSIIIGLWKW